MLEFNICYSLDSHYTEQLAVSMCSILKNSNEDENINFYILDGGLSVQDKTNIDLLKKIKNFSIEYIKINQEDFKVCPLLKEKDEKYSSYHVTLPTYFRFKLPSLLKNIDKILYIDCDVIVRTSLKELFKENLNNKALAMVVDAENKKEAKRLNLKKYYNAGVMLINLDFWRKNNVEETLFNYAKNNSDKILWQDQDIVNIVLEDRIKNISEKWNFQYFLYEKIDFKTLSDSSIIHLAGRFKPWLIPFEHPIYDYYYYYMSFTPWKNKVILYKQMSSLRYLKNNVGGSATNILLAATDEDIQKVYKEITNSYKFTEESCKLLNAKFDILQKEFSDFKFSDFDISISKVYEEISKNYEYTNELNTSSKNLIDETKTEIEGFVNKSVETISELQDEKISKVYDEISKNYDYTNELNRKVDDKVNQNKEEIQGLINSSREDITQQTDEKISKVYDEISKNYDYTNELNRKVDEKVNQNKEEVQGLINSSKEDITQQTDEKISKVYEEISKNYDYTNELNKNINDLKYNTDKKESYIYSFINEKNAELYNLLSEYQGLLEGKINQGNNEQYQKNLEIEYKINNILENKTDKKDLDLMNRIMKNKIEDIEELYKSNFDELRNKFSDELNNQRVKYEKKLIEMENIIKSLDEKYEPKRNSLLERIKNKIKRVK